MFYAYNALEYIFEIEFSRIRNEIVIGMHYHCDM